MGSESTWVSSFTADALTDNGMRAVVPTEQDRVDACPYEPANQQYSAKAYTHLFSGGGEEAFDNCMESA